MRTDRMLTLSATQEAAMGERVTWRAKFPSGRVDFWTEPHIEGETSNATVVPLYAREAL